MAGPSKHFSWYEVRRGRSPWNAYLAGRARRHAARLEVFRAKLQAKRISRGQRPIAMPVLSWYRPEWYNRIIGGARRSRHIQADATDFTREFVQRALGSYTWDMLANQVFYNGGVGTYPGGSRHMDSRGYRSRWTSW